MQRQKTRNCNPDRTVDEIYQATLQKTAYLRECNYTVIEKWGCEFAREKKTDPELMSFLETFELIEPLELRDAFFGGRTGATTLYAKAGENEDIDYVDFTSPYPWVNKYRTYPVGFPQTFFHPADQNIWNYYGIAKVDIPAENRREGLFAEYVNTWLKLKQESAGWPANCVTEEQKAEYVRQYEQKENIKLENVAENPGRKVIAKMLLNR